MSTFCGALTNSGIREIFEYLRTDFHGDISDYAMMDLFLCPSDFNPGNFEKRTMEDGRLIVVALDFRATCFMPPPFIEVALKTPFAERLSGGSRILIDSRTMQRLCSPPLVPLFRTVRNQPVRETIQFQICSHSQADFYHCAALPPGVSRTSNAS